MKYAKYIDNNFLSDILPNELKSKTIEELNALGWYEFIEAEEVKDYQKANISYKLENRKIIQTANITELSIEDYKKIKKKEIKQLRNQKLTEGFICSLGFPLDCDLLAITNFNAMLKMMELTGITETTVRDKNNVSHKVTSDEFIQLAKELGYTYQSIFSKKWELEDLINSKKTLEEVSLVEWGKTNIS